MGHDFLHTKLNISNKKKTIPNSFSINKVLAKKINNNNFAFREEPSIFQFLQPIPNSFSAFDYSQMLTNPDLLKDKTKLLVPCYTKLKIKHLKSLRLYHSSGY